MILRPVRGSNEYKMNNVPAEFLYALVFAAILFVQYLLKRFSGRPQPADALQDSPIPDELPPQREVPVPARWTSGAKVPTVSLPSTTGWILGLEEAPAAHATIPRRRSTARSVLGGGQDLRRVIVGMTLLGPCRAQQPPESR